MGFFAFCFYFSSPLLPLHTKFFSVTHSSLLPCLLDGHPSLLLTYICLEKEEMKTCSHQAQPKPYSSYYTTLTPSFSQPSDCGVFHLTDPEIRAEAKQRTPDAAKDIDAMSFGCLPADAFEASIAEDVRKLRAEKVLRGVEVRGMALDTFTGLVREVVV